VSSEPDADRVPPDSALVARTLDGDAAAFRGLVDRYYEPCARYAARMLGRREDAEDAVQETFVRVHRALGGYDERQTFRAWLYRVLVNQCRSLARSRSRRERWQVADGDAAARGAAVAAASSETRADMRDALQVALDGLEPLLREALLLRYGEELEYEEMARVTGAGVSALKMRVKRARDAVRPMLEDAFGG
jgi:RNA polymerase sigma-70 factor (ECF subfamily)